MFCSPYSAYFIFLAFPGHAYIFGHMSKYEISVIDPSGKSVLKIKKTQRPDRLTRREKDEFINTIRENNLKYIPKSEFEKACDFPRYKPFFKNILGDDLRRIYIQHFKYFPGKQNKEINKYDLFDKNGYYLYCLKISVSPEVIRSGYIYCQTSDPETHYPRVIRYKIKNWNQLKEYIPAS